jgi:putative addiction module component (TIGR02574 family)
MTPTMQSLGIDKLTPAERIELIGEIRDSLPPQAHAIPLDHQIELQRRLLDAEQNPNDESPWEDVRAQVLGEL